jgi:hypothetical protein
MNYDLPMKIDIAGRIRNTKLAASNYLQPLFEAITNSFDAIEDINNIANGLVKVILYRRKQKAIDSDDFSKEPVTAFKIEDNGIGFDDKNFRSFMIADTTLKQERGGKGVGRFIWLKAFKKVHIDSIFKENGHKWRRIFDFSRIPDGVENHNKQSVHAETSLITSVLLDHFEEKYQEKCPIDSSIIARRIIEHFLEYFIFQDVPKIELIDYETKEIHDLNAIFLEEFEPNLEPENLKVEDESFTIHDVLIKKPLDRQHQAHFCANRRVVESENLSNKIPNLDRGLRNESGDSIFYSAYVSSSFLDERVDTDRTNFRITRRPSPLISGEVSWQELLDNVVEKSKEFLRPYTIQACEETLQRVQRYVENEEPKYRYLLSSQKDVVKELPSTISDAKLGIELYRIHFQVKSQLKKEIAEHLAQKETEITDWELHREQFRSIFKKLDEVTKSDLAEYVVNRKSVLSFLEKKLGKDDDGRYAKEEALHEIIFPLRKTSDDIQLKDHNLWIVDERLVYHHYLASDLPFKQQIGSPIDVESESRPDIIIFNKALALTESDYPFNSIVIIEFKRPERSNFGEDRSPINQVFNYIRLIKDGKAKDEKGETIAVNPSIPFYCYVIATLTPELRKECDNYSYTPTPDGLGIFGYNNNLNVYIEIISYRKLIADAIKWNIAFFDKLCL